MLLRKGGPESGTTGFDPLRVLFSPIYCFSVDQCSVHVVTNNLYDCLEQYKYTVIQGNWWTIASVVRYRFYGNADDEALGTDMKPTGKVRLSERQTILVEIWKRKRTPFPPQAKQTTDKAKHCYVSCNPIVYALQHSMPRRINKGDYNNFKSQL